MERARIEEIEKRTDSATVQRPLTDALGATNLALNHYELAPGDSFAYGYHAHETQEEVFVIQQGQVTFETEDGDVGVSAGEAIRFAPGEFQQGTNTGEERVVALAVGAPQETGDSPILRHCDACGERTRATLEGADECEGVIARCQECGAETGRFE